MKNLKNQLKKLYLKILKASVKRKWNKVRDLNAKMIQLELQLKKEENNAE